jgi:hypothetical protein
MIFSLQIIFKQLSPLGKGRVWQFQSLLTVANTLYIDKGSSNNFNPWDATAVNISMHNLTPWQENPITYMALNLILYLLAL